MQLQFGSILLLCSLSKLKLIIMVVAVAVAVVVVVVVSFQDEVSVAIGFSHDLGHIPNSSLPSCWGSSLVV